MPIAMCVIELIPKRIAQLHHPFSNPIKARTPADANLSQSGSYRSSIDLA